MRINKNNRITVIVDKKKQYNYNYPNGIELDNRLNGKALKVFLILLYSEEKLSYERLAELCECSVRVISDAIQNLKEYEYINKIDGIFYLKTKL